ncbi:MULTISPECIES: DUF3127 domain-containing protein [unclassified Myroides]|uniref:DUF3127 domain-containing protein n=1 Tax=unclassified Myroides TaxID=2642485 RepID=UPI003D2F946B
MDISGRVKMIGQPQHVSQAFKKRELVLTTEEQYPQDILIEFHQDKVNLLDMFRPGDAVKVYINLRGREWTSPQGEVKYFNTVQGWKIESLNIPNNAQQHNYQQPPTGQYTQQGNGFAQHPQGNQGMPNQFAQQAPQGQQFPPVPQYNEGNHDDLPF